MGTRQIKKNQLKEFAPAGFLLNTSEFFVANETQNIWRSFPTQRGFKILHFITATNGGTCRYFFFLQFSGTFVKKSWTAKRSAPSAPTDAGVGVGHRRYGPLRPLPRACLTLFKPVIKRGDNGTRNKRNGEVLRGRRGAGERTCIIRD